MSSTFDVDPIDLMYPDASYPSPASATSTQPEQSNKKKRKAWGQPVPPINPILPPRKRAKTAEEKEQRKNERILRNRRAADKSRQRQKLAVAELETTKIQMEKENADLRQMLEEYRTRFGPIEGFSFISPPPGSSRPEIKEEPESDLYSSAESPLSVDTDFPQTAIANNQSISPDSPMMQLDHVSPPLAPTLFPPQDQSVSLFQSQPPHQVLVAPDFGVDFSGMTQYPAAILCDLQCQPDKLSSEILTLQDSLSNIPSNTHNFTLFLHHLSTLHLYTMIFETYSTTMLSPLYQIFQILAETLSTTSVLRDFSTLLDQHFHLLHSLISTPSAPTKPQGTFRMKLLSRLLACSPMMARLLLAATDRALRRVVEYSDVDFVMETPEVRWYWASLMTMKWAILCLEREHRRYRNEIFDGGKDPQQAKAGALLEGVDYDAVNRSSWRWKLATSTSCLSGGEIQVGNQNVQNEHQSELEVH